LHEAALKPTEKAVGYSVDRPHVYDPYPHYNNKEWFAMDRAEYVTCEGPAGVPMEDIMVFKGTPHDFPAPGFGTSALSEKPDWLRMGTLKMGIMLRAPRTGTRSNGASCKTHALGITRLDSI
jgi:hypothetical protein